MARSQHDGRGLLHVRTYSQVMRDFEKLDQKEVKVKSFFEPLEGPDLLTVRTTVSPNKHRYSAVLDWNDDISTIMHIDKHDGGLSARSIVAKRRAASAGRVQPKGPAKGCSQVLAAAVEAAMAVVKRPPSAQPQITVVSSKLVDSFLARTTNGLPKPNASSAPSSRTASPRRATTTSPGATTALANITSGIAGASGPYHGRPSTAPVKQIGAVRFAPSPHGPSPSACTSGSAPAAAAAGASVPRLGLDSMVTNRICANADGGGDTFRIWEADEEGEGLEGEEGFFGVDSRPTSAAQHRGRPPQARSSMARAPLQGAGHSHGQTVTHSPACASDSGSLLSDDALFMYYGHNKPRKGLLRPSSARHASGTTSHTASAPRGASAHASPYAQQAVPSSPGARSSRPPMAASSGAAMMAAYGCSPPSRAARRPISATAGSVGSAGSASGSGCVPQAQDMLHAAGQGGAGRPTSAPSDPSWNVRRMHRQGSAIVTTSEGMAPFMQRSKSASSNGWLQGSSPATPAPTSPTSPGFRCTHPDVATAVAATAGLAQRSNTLGLDAKNLKALQPKQGYSNGLLWKDPAGPAVATHRAIRPLSAHAASGGGSSSSSSSMQVGAASVRPTSASVRPSPAHPFGSPSSSAGASGLMRKSASATAAGRGGGGGGRGGGTGTEGLQMGSDGSLGILATSAALSPRHTYTFATPSGLTHHRAAAASALAPGTVSSASVAVAPAPSSLSPGRSRLLVSSHAYAADGASGSGNGGHLSELSHDSADGHEQGYDWAGAPSSPTTISVAASTYSTAGMGGAPSVNYARRRASALEAARKAMWGRVSAASGLHPLDVQLLEPEIPDSPHRLISQRTADVASYSMQDGATTASAFAPQSGPACVPVRALYRSSSDGVPSPPRDMRSPSPDTLAAYCRDHVPQDDADMEGPLAHDHVHEHARGVHGLSAERLAQRAALHTAVSVVPVGPAQPEEMWDRLDVPRGAAGGTSLPGHTANTTTAATAAAAKMTQLPNGVPPLMLNALAHALESLRTPLSGGGGDMDGLSPREVLEAQADADADAGGGTFHRGLVLRSPSMRMAAAAEPGAKHVQWTNALLTPRSQSRQLKERAGGGGVASSTQDAHGRAPVPASKMSGQGKPPLPTYAAGQAHGQSPYNGSGLLVGSQAGSPPRSRRASSGSSSARKGQLPDLPSTEIDTTAGVVGRAGGSAMRSGSPSPLHGRSRATSETGLAGQAASMQSAHTPMQSAHAPMQHGAVSLDPLALGAFSSPAAAAALMAAVGGDAEEVSAGVDEDPATDGFYTLSARVDEPGDLSGWLFNVYLTQISSPDNARHAPGRPPPLTVHRHCIAHSTCVDKDAYILVPSSLEDPSPTPFISPAALLPWLHAPIQLYGQWLRLEAYSLVPRATKVVDGLVYMGDLTPSGSHGTGSGHASGPGLHGGGGAGRHGGVPEAPSLERVSAAVQLHLAAGLGGRRLSEATGI